MVFAELMDPIFRPLLGLNPLFAVGLVSLLVSVIITVIYKFTTNQDLMKSLKDELKELQKEMKALKENPAEMMKVQKRAMETNMKYMMQSFKSTLYTFLPIILIFAWMSANFAFNPISPDEQFQVLLNFEKGTTGNVLLTVPEGIEIIGDAEKEASPQVIYNLKGIEGVYNEGNALKFEYNDRTFFKDVIITNNQNYAQKELKIQNSNLQSIVMGYHKKVILPIINWGWLGSYIIFSIAFSMLLRKWLKVY